MFVLNAPTAGKSSVTIRLYKDSKIIMTQEEKTKIEEKIVDVLKTVYDPEIPVIYFFFFIIIYQKDIRTFNHAITTHAIFTSIS